MILGDKSLISEVVLSHLFFDRAVARQVWVLIAEIFGFEVGSCYESMAKCWLCNKKIGIVNVFSAAVCWGIWKLRNALCFQGVPWRNMK
jgi:hypothetical protein